MKNYSVILPSPIGQLGLIIENEALTEIDLLSTHTSLQPTNNALAEQFKNYFQDPHYLFTLKVEPKGTAFQQRVWQALTRIPTGTTLTYGQLAKQLNSHPRAIGQACRRNPIPIVIPCHRVVGANHLGGYTGYTDGPMADIKKWLLTHEGSLWR